MGGGHFISNTMNATFKKIVRNIKQEKRIDFFPLEEKEAEMFMNVYKVPSGLDMNEYKRLTNYNQSLLIACHICDNKYDVKSEIATVTRDYIEEIRLSLESDNFSWIRKSIPECMDMLCYAANGEMIHQSKWHNYQVSWLCAENLTYVVHSTTFEFELAINFPQTYDRLMDMLWTNGTHTNLLINNPIVNGYRYERNICSRIKKLQFSYCKQRVAGIYTESVDVKFCSRKEASEPVTKLLSGVLVMLRPTHPVIDAVLYVQLADKELLLLIQVSISTYKAHKNSQVTWFVVLLDVNELMTTKHQFVIGCSTIVVVYQPHAIKNNLNVYIYTFLQKNYTKAKMNIPSLIRYWENVV